MPFDRFPTGPASWLAGSLVFATATGCAMPGEEEFAEGVVASALQTNENRSFSKELVEPEAPECDADPEAYAAAASERPSVALIPSSCVHKTARGNALHAELEDCTGRFGRSTIDGGLDAILTRTAECRLHAEVFDSGDLIANDDRLHYAAAAEIHVIDGQSKIDWRAEWNGRTPRGHSIEQESHLAVFAEHATSCVDVSGIANGRVSRFDYELEIEGLVVCPDECPSSGTVLAHVEGHRHERNISVEFDGSDQAKVTGWSGREFDVDMVCEPVR